MVLEFLAPEAPQGSGWGLRSLGALITSRVAGESPQAREPNLLLGTTGRVLVCTFPWGPPYDLLAQGLFPIKNRGDQI